MSGSSSLQCITPAAGRAVVLAVMMACATGLPATPPAAEPRPVLADDRGQALEHQVKAVFMFKFTHFIDWPAGTFSGPEQPLVIGVIGAADIADYLERLTAQGPGGQRPVVVRRLKLDDPMDVQLLYVDPALGSRVGEVLERVGGQPVVTVTSGRDRNDAAIINFVTEDSQVHFDIDLHAARSAGLKISARLLKVARTVYGGDDS